MEGLFRFMPVKTACCISIWQNLFLTPASARLEAGGERNYAGINIQVAVFPARQSSAVFL
jgi:hypothetical protein